MKTRVGVIAIIALAALCSSCAKVRVDTDYTVRLWSGDRPGEKQELKTGAVWGAYIDTMEWTVASYEDLNRPSGAPLATSKKDGTKREFDIQLDKLTDNVFNYDFTKKPLMLVMYDETQPMFAYGDGNMTDNLSKLTVSITFEPWLSDSTYLLGKRWTIVNEDTQVPVECTYTIKPRQIKRENTSAVQMPGTTAYAIAADPKEWYVASIDDARDGVLTKVNDLSEKRTFDAAKGDLKTTLTEGSESVVFEFGGTNRDIVLILAYNEHKMFAYADADMMKNPRTGHDEVTFPAYKGTYDSRDDENHKTRWIIQLEDVPEEPEPEPEPDPDPDPDPDEPEE